MADTAIEWTDKVWNPVTGCTKVSPGCKLCYAEKIAHRFWPKGRKFADVQCHPDRLEQPLRWRKPQRIFVNSMSDLFHAAVPDDYIAAVFGVMAVCPHHTFQILTKRPERLLGWFNEWARIRTPTDLFVQLEAISAGASIPLHQLEGTIRSIPWPLLNVHLGVSCEDQKTADERIPLLLQTPAAVRFLSLEPLLSDINLGLMGTCPMEWGHGYSLVSDWLHGVIVGGESGHGARPMNEDWVRSIRDQCVEAGVAFFYKQRLENGQKIAMPELDGQVWSQLPGEAGEEPSADLG
jgi:protein gp37